MDLRKIYFQDIVNLISELIKKTGKQLFMFDQISFLKIIPDTPLLI